MRNKGPSPFSSCRLALLSLVVPPGSVLQQNRGLVWSRDWWKESQLGDFEGCDFSMAWDLPGSFWRLNLSRGLL